MRNLIVRFGSSAKMFIASRKFAWIAFVIALGFSGFLFQENRNLAFTLDAVQKTGPLGDVYAIGLPDGNIAIAGQVVSPKEANAFFREVVRSESGISLKESIYWHIGATINGEPFKLPIFTRYLPDPEKER